ncbi:hypothetical protein BJV82DRAFT_580229 [Fennellomyces sp. T-0311]|nr:hypothetical protein BJV82DRAFT_580229 [Fennellomyces sp. T-0311]
MELCPAHLFDLLKSLVAEIYANIDESNCGGRAYRQETYLGYHTNDYLASMPPVNEWTDRLASIVAKDYANEAEMMVTLGQMLFDAVSSPNNSYIVMKSANAIFDLTRGFARTAAQAEICPGQWFASFHKSTPERPNQFGLLSGVQISPTMPTLFYGGHIYFQVGIDGLLGLAGDLSTVNSI